MNPDLEQILLVDTHDRALVQLRARKKQLDQSLADAESRTTRFAEQVASLTAKLDGLRAEQRELTRQVESYEARRRSAARVLEGGGGDPEAAERQLASVAHEIDHRETRILELMEAVEAHEAELAEASTRRAEAEAFLVAERAHHGPSVQQVRDRFEQTVPLRQAALDGLDSELRARYLNLAQRKGRAVAPIAGGACSACQMVVRAQHLADLQQGGIHSCGGCGRWLFPPPPPHA